MCNQPLEAPIGGHQDDVQAIGHRSIVSNQVVENVAFVPKPVETEDVQHEYGHETDSRSGASQVGPNAARFGGDVDENETQP